MPLLPTILADLPCGKPQRDHLGFLLPLPAGLPVRPTHRNPTRFGDRCRHTHGRQAARACDFAALNLAGLCAVVPHAHELAWAGDSTCLPKSGRKLPGVGWRWHSVEDDGCRLDWTREEPDRRYRVRIENGAWFTTRDRGEVEWLDMHTGCTLRTGHPLVPRPADTDRTSPPPRTHPHPGCPRRTGPPRVPRADDTDRIAPPRERNARHKRVAPLRDRPPPKGGW